MEEQLKSKSMKLACSEHISKNSHEFIGRMVDMDISIFVTKFLFTYALSASTDDGIFKVFLKLCMEQTFTRIFTLQAKNIRIFFYES